MKLIVGGTGQGKLKYALNSSGLMETDVAFCDSENPETIFSKKIIYRLHELIRRLLSEQDQPVQYIMERVRPDHIIICDEVGCGVVPMEKTDRDYRDAVGSVCCQIAASAQSVERLCCGIPVRLK